MAVVAVGDFDAPAMESAITAEFGDLESAGEPPLSPDIGFTPPAEPRVATFVDEEAASAGVSLLWATPSSPVATVGDYQRLLAISLGLGILADRLNDDASVADSPLFGASPLDLIWARGVTLRGVDGQLRATRALDGMERLLAEVERIRREGVSAEEAQRALDGYAAFSQQSFEQRESAQDTEFVARITDHHFAGGHLMSPDQRFDVESGVLARLDEQAVETALQDLLVEAPLILALGPDDAGLEIPSPDQLRAAWSSLATADLPPRPELPDRGGDLMARPAAADIVASSVDPRFGFTSLEFENGATVYLWESDIATESVFMQAEGFGGTSVVDVPDLTEAMLMVDMAQRSGVGESNAPALRRLLADRIVSVQPWISETRQGIEGNASVEDVEWLFQLLHLTMTSPRFDEAPVDAVLDEMATLTASRADLPSVLFDEALDQAYYGDDPRYFVLPPDDEIRGFDVRTAERLYEERFGDASNFAFAFVGDFETPALSDLAARYIGTLPGSGQPGDFVDHQPLPPRAVQVATVAAGAGEQGQVGLFFTNQLEPDLDDRLTARVLELILTARLRERVREELSATYSITTGIDLQREPDAFAEAFVLSSGDPDGLDLIVAEVVSELEALQAEGPSETELSTALEQLRDELELVDNPTLATALITAHLYPDEPVRHLVDRYERVDAVTGEAVRDLAEAVFDLEQRIEVRQIPRT
jgi:zinc protease